MAVRLRDVAERAGVSIRTASNVVNNAPHVKASTRERVEAAIESLGYRPNLAAKQLKYGRSGFLTLAIPQIDSPYFAELAAKVTEVANRLGHIVLMDATGGSEAQERLVLSGMQAHIVDGVIFSPLATSPEAIANRSDRTPMVLLGERAVPAGYDHVSVDSVAASTAITQHLLDLGRRRIAAIGHESVSGTASVRLEGYRLALAQAGLAEDPALVIGVPRYQRSEGHVAMKQLLALPEPPDAVFCFNDLMAIGALRACREAGVQVPDDIAVAGFDDIAESRYYAPSLTTIAPDLDVLVSETLRLLLGRVDGSRGSADAEDVRVPWRLVVRESTAGAGAGQETSSSSQG